MERRTTITEVARSAGVSLSTVSNVLNGRHGQMSAETLLRVQQAISALGFRRNDLARSLVTQRTGSIGLIIYKLNDAFYPPVISGAEEFLNEQGYSLLLASAPDLEAERRAVETMCAKQVDGLILFSISVSDIRNEHLVSATREGTPVVVINRDVPDGFPLSRVYFDDFGGAYSAIEHLVRLGHRRIGFIAGPLSRFTIQRRMAGYLAALKDFDIPVEERLIITTSGEDSDRSIEHGRLFMQELWQQRPTGVFVAHDFLAVGALRAVNELGLRTPDNLSFVAFSSPEFVRFATPAITVTTLPVVEAGRLAAEIITKHIALPDAVVETHTLESRLMLGDTSGPPPGVRAM